MGIRQLQSLIKLIDCNYSVSKAADEMFLVQSAVSQHLKANLQPHVVLSAADINDKFLRQYQQKSIGLFLDFVGRSDDKKIQRLD